MILLWKLTGFITDIVCAGQVLNSVTKCSEDTAPMHYSPEGWWGATLFWDPGIRNKWMFRTVGSMVKFVDIQYKWIILIYRYLSLISAWYFVVKYRLIKVIWYANDSNAICRLQSVSVTTRYTIKHLSQIYRNNGGFFKRSTSLCPFDVRAKKGDFVMNYWYIILINLTLIN